jgi:hypothetical protein
VLNDQAAHSAELHIYSCYCRFVLYNLFTGSDDEEAGWAVTAAAGEIVIFVSPTRFSSVWSSV